MVAYVSFPTHPKNGFAEAVGTPSSITMKKIIT